MNYAKNDKPTIWVELGDSERKLMASLITEARNKAMREPASVRLAMLTQLGQKFGASIR